MWRNRQRRFSASDSSRRVVRRKEHERALPALDGAELGNRDLEVGEHLEQQRFGFDLHPVDLVDEQDHGVFGADRFEQRAGQQELLGEDVGLDRFPVALVLTVGLDTQELLLVVPLVEGFRLVEALVTLQSDQPRVRDLGGRLGELGLADTGRPLDEHRLPQPVGQVQDAGDARVGEIVDAAQAVEDIGN